MKEELRRFFNLFTGCKGAHGQSKLTGVKANGKAQANSKIIREPLTTDLLAQHLAGTLGVGSIPIDETSFCLFGAIDDDDYNLDLIELFERVKRFNLPLVVCRSKSGGAHLYLFLSEKIPASELRDKLSEYASALGLGNCEIFPKQDSVIVERGDVGNFINLPYFNCEYTTRYAIDSQGESLSLSEFLDLAESSKRSLDELNEIIFGVEDILPHGPPCLQQLAGIGIPEGGRNNVLLNAGIYFKLAFPEEWKGKLEGFNQRYCSPALPAKEIVTIQNQLDKKDYFYTCKQEPVHSHCNRAKCRLRKYGIGNGHALPILGGLTVVESEPPVWFVDMDGNRLELSTKQLQIQTEFQRAAMEQLFRMPSKVKEGDWRDLVDGLLENATRISVPEELTHKGQFVELVEGFCTSRIRAHSPEELLVGKPFTENGFTYFKLSALQDYLKRCNFHHYTRGQITERLKELNIGGSAQQQYFFTDDSGQRRKVRVWCVPEIERGEITLPPVTFESNKAPF